MSKKVDKEKIKRILKEGNFGFCLGFIEDIIVQGLISRFSFTRPEARELVNVIVHKYIKGD
jgi:hypothetical protein